MARSVATVDLDAIAANVATLARLGRLCAVVKADAYGHGAVPVARTALAAGAEWLGVAQVDEAAELRSVGLDAPILVLSEPHPRELRTAAALRLRLVVYRSETVDAAARVARELGSPPLRLHLKVDTGMRRVGSEPDQAVDLARRIHHAPGLVLEGVMTHHARADEPSAARITDAQRDSFDSVVDQLARAGLQPPLRHVANSATALARPDAALDLIRTGIAIYGIPPSPALAGCSDLRPALRWTTEVSFTKVVGPGAKVSYGHHHEVTSTTVLATVPVGYADGVSRRLGLVGGQVLIGGRRRPVVGAVTMDQLVVDCGPPGDAKVAVGDEVVLIGAQGDQVISPDDWAVPLDTISYEIVTRISARVGRCWVGAQEPHR